MTGRISFTFLLLILFFPAFGLCQTPTPGATSHEPVKVNARPSPSPRAVMEPFEKADVKTMAAKCVMLDTEAGSIQIELYPESAPETVRNFLDLVAIGAYDTTTFGRVVPGFVIQGGNLGTREAPISVDLAKRARHIIPDEPNKILHERGVVSMARGDEPNTATTHFFVLVDAAPSLDGKFAAFGRVIKGMDVVDAINKAPVEGEKPVKPVRLKKATVLTCPAPPQS
jgi:peptidyl-prolyl cis-trans isomerase B (cyclophilin B)